MNAEMHILACIVLTYAQWCANRYTTCFLGKKNPSFAAFVDFYGTSNFKLLMWSADHGVGLLKISVANCNTTLLKYKRTGQVSILPGTILKNLCES
jgi:hypothetical protein